MWVTTDKVAAKVCQRIGAEKKGTNRPVRVSFENQKSAMSVLVGAKGLKQTSDFRNVFISPDRASKKERTCISAEGEGKERT